MEEAEGAGSADGQAWKYMCAELKTFFIPPETMEIFYFLQEEIVHSY